MTSLNNPVKLPLDANGNVLANINAQNINPNVNNVAGSVAGSVASVTGNVGGSVASVTGAVGSVTNPVTSWVTISHQTGLSASISTALAPVNIGSAISITKDGKIQIGVSGHVSADIGGIRIARTRNSVIDYINQKSSMETNTSMNGSIFTDGMSGGTGLQNSYGFDASTRTRLNVLSSDQVTNNDNEPSVLTIEALNGDSLQFQVTNNTASTTVYIDDLVVQQQ